MAKKVNDKYKELTTEDSKVETEGTETEENNAE